MTYSGTERRSIVYLMNFRLAPISFCKKACTCNRRFLCSNMIGMLCTAFWVPSRAIYTIRCCPHPESFCLILDYLGYMLDFVVDLVEEHVDLDGSQFSESNLERWYSARASQRNVAVLEFGSPFLTLSSSTPKFSPFCPFLVHRCFCCGNVYGLGHRNKLVNQIVML